jgi:tetratricopeptide (TPR) repeat protein
MKQQMLIIKRIFSYSVSLAAWLAVLSFSLPPLSAQVNSRTITIAVVGFQPTISPLENDLIEGMHAYLKWRADLKVIPSDSIGTFITTQELKQDSSARAELNRAEELYKQGKKAYELLKIDQAIQYFEQSLSMFNKTLPYLESNRYLLMTYLYLGMSKISLKRVDEGRRDIRSMLAIDPQRQKRTLNTKFFPPDIIATYRKLKKEVVTQANASLNVAVDQIGARVLLDGNRLETAPVTIASLVPGAHRLTVYKRGFERWSENIEVKSGANNVTVKMERWVPFKTVAGASPLGEHTALFRSAGESLRASVLILGNVENTAKNSTANNSNDRRSYSIRTQLHGLNNGEFSSIETEKIDDLGQAKQRGFRLAKLLLDHLTAQGEVMPPTAGAIAGAANGFQSMEPDKAAPDKLAPQSPQSNESPNIIQTPEQFVYKEPTPPKVRELRTPFYKEPLFWWIVGGAAVAGVGGVLLFTDVAKTDADNNVLVIGNPGN